VIQPLLFDLDLDLEFNFPKPCWRAEFLSVRKRTEQSLFQILVKFPNCFGNSTLGKQLIWIWKRDFWLAGSKISPFSSYFFITTTNQSSSNKTMATTTTKIIIIIIEAQAKSRATLNFSSSLI
jgi:hypothetical protein